MHQKIEHIFPEKDSRKHKNHEVLREFKFIYILRSIHHNIENTNI